VTSTDYREFDRDPGIHTIVITLPSGQHWTREIDLEAGRIKCVALNYRAAPPMKSPCPYPVNVSAPAQVNEGEIIVEEAGGAGGKIVAKMHGVVHLEGHTIYIRYERRQEVEYDPDFVAFDIPDEFVVGYGLDYEDMYRNLPYLAALEPEDIARHKETTVENQTA